MTKKEMLVKARYINAAGKLIYDKVNEIGVRYLGNGEQYEETIELSLPQKNMVMIIRRQGEMTMTDLARQLGVSPPSVSAMVDRLVEKKILVREHSTLDRRKVVVRISADTRSMMEGIENNVLGFFIELVEKLGPEPTEKWCQVLERVESILQSEMDKTKKG